MDRDERNFDNGHIQTVQITTKSRASGRKENREAEAYSQEGKESKNAEVSESQKSEIKSFHFEYLSVLKVTLHDVQDRLWEAHAEEGIPNLGVSVDLLQLEETPSDL